MDARYSDILTRSWEIFQRFGIRSVSMDDISTRLGISKKTLYTYVNNKTELVEHALHHRHQLDMHLMDHRGPEPQNAIDFLLEMSRNVCTRISATNPALVYDMKKYYPEILDKFSLMHREFYAAVFQRNLEEGIREGIYREDIDKDLTIKVYLNSIEHLFGEELIPGTELSTSEIFRGLFGNHIRSIASPQGLAYFESKEMNYTI